MNGTEIAFVEDSQYTQVAGNLVINNPQHGRDGGSYQCLAINRCGTIVSRVANLKFGCEYNSNNYRCPSVKIRPQLDEIAHY